MGDAEWAGSAVQSTVGFDSQTGASGTEGGEYRLAYDDKFIYFAARLTDSKPGQIQAIQFRPNAGFGGDDFCGLAIDPFGTLADLNRFEINPLGTTNIRVNGGRAAKREWLGEMEAKARRTETGWEAEAKIPWSVMRLPHAGLHDMRFHFYRYMRRTQRVTTTENLANGQNVRMATWTGVTLPEISRPKTLNLLPYGYGGYEDREGVVANAGLDFKYGINEDLDLIGSVNPDFRNIENQVLNLDFSYFERLAGETRPFFLEGADYFRTSMDAPLFVPQRIQSFDSGLKTYGKVTPKTQVAVLNTEDFGVQDATVGNVRQSLGPRTDLTIAGTRLSRPDLLNEGSYLGFSHGFGRYGMFLQHEGTTDSKEGQGRRTNAGLNYGKDGLGVGMEWVEVTPNFLPRLGFAPRRDYRGMSTGLGYTKVVPRGSLMEFGFNGGVQKYERFNGDNFSEGFNLNGSLTFRDATDVDFGYSRDHFGTNHDELAYLDIENPRGDLYHNCDVGVRTGRIAGKRYLSVSQRIAFRPLPRLQINASHQSLTHFRDSEQAIINANFDMNQSDSVSGRLVRTDSHLNWYLSFRRSGNKGNEYYVILGDPNAQSFRTSLVLKAVFPLTIRL